MDTLSATDGDGQSFYYEITSNGTLGTAVLTNADTGTFEYTPNANISGIDTFKFNAIVDLGVVESNTAIITVSINPVNTISCPRSVAPRAAGRGPGGSAPRVRSAIPDRAAPQPDSRRTA